MTLQIGDNTLDVEPEATGAVSRTRTCNSDVSENLFRSEDDRLFVMGVLWIARVGKPQVERPAFASLALSLS